jgi:carbamate kinase
MPVVLDEHSRPSRVKAVVDEDLAAAVLACTVAAERLLMLTDVDGVYDGYGTPAARRIDTLSPLEARVLADAGALGKGSMRPKVEAAARFAEHGGIATIAALADARDALAGRRGTTVAVWPSCVLRAMPS